MGELAEKIAGEIRLRGAIPFERFMELALYCPVYGYYEKEADTVGRAGDYYTSVSVGPVFGQLLAFQFAEWLQEVATADPDGALHLVEAGAHGGQLATDILAWIKTHREALFDRLEYWVVEPSSTRQRWQKSALAGFEGKVRWSGSFDELKSLLPKGFPGVRGVIFSNELLDAMPVRRFAWDAREQQWFEWDVALNASGPDLFKWQRGAKSRGELNGPTGPLVPPELAPVLPDGFVVEASPAAEGWWAEAAGALNCGKLMTLDYGRTQDERLIPERAAGSLRGYRKHSVVKNVLTAPGEQDLTCEVDFSAIQAVGENAGLTTDEFTLQSQFLTRIAARVWNQGRVWGRKERMQFQTLTHPQHLGRRFRVLVQSRP